MKGRIVAPGITSVLSGDSLTLSVLCVAVAAIPLALWPLLSDIYDLPKAVLLWGLGSLALLVMALRWAVSAAPPAYAGDRAAQGLAIFPPGPARSAATLVVLVSALVVAATLFSVDPATSVFGKYARHNGLLTWLSMAALALAAASVRWSETRLTLVSGILFAGAVLSSLYGLAQTVGWDPVTQVYPFTAGRSAGTFGNPSLFVGYLVFSLPIAAALFLKLGEEGSRLRWPVVLGFGVIVAAVVMTLARGGWVAAIAATLVMLYGVRDRISARRRALAVLAGSAMVIVIALVAVTVLWERPELDLVRRTAQTAQLGEGSLAIRFETWRAAAEAIAERPVLGWGPDTFGLVSGRFESKRFVTLAGAVSEDNAHNVFIQAALDAGIPFAVTLVAIIALILRYGLASRRDLDAEGDAGGGAESKTTGLRVLRAGWTAGATGYFVAVLTTVNPVGSGFLLFIALGLVASLATPGSALEAAAGTALPARKPGRRPPLSTAAAVAAAVLSFVAFIAVVVIGGRFVVADYRYNEALRLEQLNLLAEAQERHRGAIRLNPWEGRFARAEGRARVVAGLGANDPGAVLAAIERFEEIKKRSSNDVNSYMFTGQTYLAAARQFEAIDSLTRGEMVERAAANFNGALQLRPNGFEGWSFLAAAYFDQKRYAAARDAARRAVALYPDAQAHFYLGRIAQLRGDIEEAKKQYRRAVAIDRNAAEARAALDDLPPASEQK